MLAASGGKTTRSDVELVGWGTFRYTIHRINRNEQRTVRVSLTPYPVVIGVRWRGGAEGRAKAGG